MEGLLSDKQKKESTGVKLSKGQTDKIVRVVLGHKNEGKLDNATASYAVSLKKFKMESETLMEKRLRLMNPVVIEVSLSDQFFRAELKAVTSCHQEVRNIENFQGIMMNFSNIDNYKASILPPLDEKMNAVAKFEDVAAPHDKRFNDVNISSIENSKLTLDNDNRSSLGGVRESAVLQVHRKPNLSRA